MTFILLYRQMQNLMSNSQDRSQHELSTYRYNPATILLQSSTSHFNVNIFYSAHLDCSHAGSALCQRCQQVIHIAQTMVEAEADSDRGAPTVEHNLMCSKDDYGLCRYMGAGLSEDL